MADIPRFLYHTVPGRLVLKPLTSRFVSDVCGKWLDMPLSGVLIRPFITRHGIDTDEYEMEGIRSFNSFFTRKIREGRRPVDMREDYLIAPCDGLLSVYPIRGGAVIPVKQSRYTIDDLLKDPVLASHYRDGYCFVYRLCVDHYHRYCYVDSGRKSANRRIRGILHTVRPVALAAEPVFSQNSREYTLIDSPAFGQLVQMEVGAMLVGRIVNHMEEGFAVRGAEKGFFLYGGSTIIVLVRGGRAIIRPQILEATDRGEEIPVRLGEAVAVRPDR